jgi:hypothetical protein
MMTEAQGYLADYCEYLPDGSRPCYGPVLGVRSDKLRRPKQGGARWHTRSRTPG